MPGRFSLLLFSILLSLLFGPFLKGFQFAHDLVNGLFTITLIAAVASLRRPPWAFNVGLALIVPALGLMWIPLLFDTRFERVAYLFEFLALGFTAVMMVVHTVQERRIGTEQIAAALSAYLLFGLAWGFAYYLLETIAPGSLSTNETLSTNDFSTHLYFSFVTLTTLGYGDISPVSEQARSLAVVEAVVGQLYVAVLIGKLVGMYSRDGSR
jgi:hypothetical protein